MSDVARPRVTPQHEQAYLTLVQNEIDRLDVRAPLLLRRHRAARTIVIVFGSAVPVLAAWTAVPRPVLGGVGAVAAAAEAVAQLFQFHPMATNMLATRNALERELNRFVMGAGQYAGQRSFSMFVDRIEAIREVADKASHEAWNKATVPASEQEEAHPG